MNRTIKTSIGRYEVLDNAIIVQYIVGDISTKEAEEHLSVGVKEFSETAPHRVLGDATQLKSMSKGGRDLGVELGGQFIGVLALLINSSVQKIIANLFLRFTKPPYKTKVFTDREKAIKWLLEQKI